MSYADFRLLSLIALGLVAAAIAVGVAWGLRRGRPRGPRDQTGSWEDDL